MVDYKKFTEEEFSKLTLEEIKTFNINKIKIADSPLIFRLITFQEIEIIESLIDELDLNVKNIFGDTPLYWACFCKNLEIVTLLLNRFKVLGTLNLNINSKNKDGDTLLYCACYKNNFEMIKLLLENGAIPEVNEEGNYECLENIYNKNRKEKLQDFIFEFQTSHIKKAKNLFY